MALRKKFQPVEVIPNDGYEGAHRYRARMCTGYDSKKQTSTYIDKTDTIQFVQKNEDGSVIPGWSEASKKFTFDSGEGIMGEGIDSKRIAELN